MSKIKHILIALALIVSAGVAVVAIEPVAAINVFDDACTVNPNATICQSSGDTTDTVVSPIVSMLLTVLGAISIIVIIVGGIMYAVSAGDPGKAKKAKDTILYAVVGLVVAMLAYGIVAFVVGEFS